MAKMNRRDYLIQMGLGVSTFVGVTSLEAFGLGSNRSDESRASKPTQPTFMSPLTWLRRTADPVPLQPRSDVVRLIFYGLMGISYKIEGTPGKSICYAGFHRSGDLTHHHRLSVYAYSTAACQPVVYPPANGNQHIRSLAIATEKAVTKYDEAYFYQVGDPVTRKDLTDDNDFRWIVDFESDYMYGPAQGTQSLNPHPGIYRPTFPIPFGLFYTLRKTQSTFNLQTVNLSDQRPLYNVGDVIGASIFVEPNTAVRLTINGKTYSVLPPGEIYFINHCHKFTATQSCDHVPASSNKKERNDFYLQYKAFDMPVGREEYELRLLVGGLSPNIPGLACAGKLPASTGLNHKKMAIDEIRMTDEAPCSAGGYGGGGGLPYP